MSDTKPLAQAAREAETPTEAVAIMRRVGERGINAEKMSWTLARLLERQPDERHTHRVLALELHSFLVDTASMIKAIKYLSVGSERWG
jgi:hypothetical protein